MVSTPRTENETPKRLRQQMVVADLGRNALGTTDLDQLLSDAATCAAEALDADCAMVFELLPDDDAVLRHGSGWEDDRVDVEVSARPDTDVGYALHTKEPVLVDNFRTEDRFSGPELLTGHDVGSGISVRIGPADDPWGVLGTYSTDSHRFDAHDAYVVQSIANVLAAAIDRADTDRRLSEREAQLDVATKAASVGLWTWDIQENVVVPDESLAEMYGMDPAGSTTGAPMEAFYESILDEDTDQTWDQLERAVEETGKLQAEYRVRDGTGNVKWILARGSVVYDDDGEPVQLNGAVTDITERKRREHALEKSEERYRELFSSMTEGFCVIEKVETPPGEPVDFRYVEANPAFKEQSGLGDVVGKTIRDVVPDESQEWFDIYDTVVEERDAVRFERELVTQERVLEVYAFPVGDEAKRHAGVIFTDITERKRRESESAEMIRKIQESEERLQLALEAGEMGMWELDLRNGQSPVRSPRHDQIFGYEEPLADWDVETFLEHVHPDDREEVQQRFESAYETGKWAFECRISRADGEQRVIEAHGEFYTDDEDEPDRAVGIVKDVTDRYDHERYLEDAKARLEAATEAGAIGTWEWQIPENEMVVGSSFAQTFGVDPEAAREGIPLEAFGDSLHEDDHDRVVAAVELAVESCGEYEEEYRVWNADGELQWVIARGNVVCDENGNAVSFRGVLIDITERKAAEMERRESEARYRTLFESIDEGFCIVEMLFDDEQTPVDYRIVEANPAFETYTGLVNAEGKTVNELGANLEEYWYELYGDVALTGEPTEFEQHVEEWGRWFDGYAFRIGDPHERKVAILFDEVSDRKAAEAALRESEAKFRMVAENLEEIVWITTADATEFLYISPSFDEIWGVYRQTLYDDPSAYEEWVHPDDRERVRENFALVPDVAFDEEFRIVRPDGDRRWLHVRGERVENAEGMAQVIGIGQDITDRVERARELEASNRRLEQFAYAASHDLKEPLRMVASYLQLLERRYGTDLDEDAREFIDFAVDGANRMRKMVNGLLAYSRVETQGESFESVDLDAVLEDVQTDLQLQVEESSATIVTDALPRVLGDGEQLRQVFQNLVSNAIAYRDDEPPRVHVTAARTGPMWRVSVRDEGIGIDPADVDRVFEVFERLHTCEGHEGTGIGLAICKRIVERHGGEIWVDSEPGEWTTFSVTLPATET